MFAWISEIFRQMGYGKSRKRLDLKFVSYDEAEVLLKEGYVIAKEEDNNHVFGWVYLEKLE